MTTTVLFTWMKLWWVFSLRNAFYFFIVYLSILDIKRNLLQLLSEESVPSFDSRILVVGAYEAGKTTLVANLIGNEIPRDRQSTDGIDVYFGKLLFDLKTHKLLQNTKGKNHFLFCSLNKKLGCVFYIFKYLHLNVNKGYGIWCSCRPSDTVINLIFYRYDPDFLFLLIYSLLL